MKVQVTVEIGEDERIGIAALVASEFRPATRIECRNWAETVLEKALLPIERRVAHTRDDLIESLTDSADNEN